MITTQGNMIYALRQALLCINQLLAMLLCLSLLKTETTLFLIISDARHSVAIADMGNYQEVLRQMSPLREVDPGQNRVHMFGNPFKLAKDQVGSIMHLPKCLQGFNTTEKIKGKKEQCCTRVFFKIFSCHVSQNQN